MRKELVGTVLLSLVLLVSPLVASVLVAGRLLRSAPVGTGLVVATSPVLLRESSDGRGQAGLVEAGGLVAHTGVSSGDWLQVISGGRIYWVTRRNTTEAAGWGSCPGMSLGGVSFPAGRVRPSTRAVLAVDGSAPGSFAQVTFWVRRRGVPCAFSLARTESGSVGPGSAANRGLPSGVFTVDPGWRACPRARARCVRWGIVPEPSASGGSASLQPQAASRVVVNFSALRCRSGQGLLRASRPNSSWCVALSNRMTREAIEHGANLLGVRA